MAMLVIPPEGISCHRPSRGHEENVVVVSDAETTWGQGGPRIAWWLSFQPLWIIWLDNMA